MKKSILTATVLVALTAGAAVAAVAPGTGIVGSAHDMNYVAGIAGSTLTADAQGRVCAFCHTPHHALADVSGDQQPLWSHTFTAINSWVPYDSPTLDLGPAADPLYGPSRLCMSCHDGVVAADQHYATAGTGSSARLVSDDFNGVAIGKADVSGSGVLSNDHPIGFDYEAVAAVDTGIFRSLARPFISGKAGGPTVDKVLFDGRMTCATCHDVHNKDNVPNPTGGLNYFVYAPQDGSALCLTCHAKGAEDKP